MLEVKGLTKRYPLNAGFFAPLGDYVNAVTDVSFKVERGQIFGLVGESGSGKTTIARMLVRLVEPTSGEIQHSFPEGTYDVAKVQGSQLKAWRRKARYIFQDPARSLNPRHSVLEILTLGTQYLTGKHDKHLLTQKAEKLLVQVGLRPDDLERRPGDFSGGQRQRISIARALMTDPELLICDEVVSALDVSVQAQILKLLLHLRETLGLTMLFIAHDLSVVHFLCDHVAVLNGGRIVEEGDPRKIWVNPEHPYTQKLIEAVPVIR